MEMKKGFILTISTLYYVALFILFLSLVVVMSNRTLYVGSESTQSQRNNAGYVQGDATTLPASSEYWCSNHMGAYDANLNLNTQSPLTYKKYCEDYNGKRII